MKLLTRYHCLDFVVNVHSGIRHCMENIVFAWAGGLEKGEPHYYRVQGPTFLLEYANTQNNANHVHAVWRDFEGDFGRDLLKEHYQAYHKAE